LTNVPIFPYTKQAFVLGSNMAVDTASLTTNSSPRGPRQDNRRQPLLDAAAALFRVRGFHAVTMREIAKSAGMLAGSVYYHFPSKDGLLVSVYEEGVRLIADRVEEACQGTDNPWKKLEAACRAHTEMLLDESDYAQVILKVMPEDVPSGEDQLIACRDGYENLFRKLVDDLPLARTVDRTMLRLTLLGALNSAKNWYRPDGMPPGDVATKMIELLKNSLQEKGSLE
jgi:TetR/AcrR family transcriptional regulator, cholesterol catabolism regulator